MQRVSSHHDRAQVDNEEKCQIQASPALQFFKEFHSRFSLGQEQSGARIDLHANGGEQNGFYQHIAIVGTECIHHVDMRLWPPQAGEVIDKVSDNIQGYENARNMMDGL